MINMAVIGNLNELIKKIIKFKASNTYYINESTSNVTLYYPGGDVSFVLGPSYVSKMSTPKKKEAIKPPEFVKDCSVMIIDELKRLMEAELQRRYLVYYEFYKRCLVVSDDRAETAYITYNELVGDYEIHYCKPFLIEKICTDAVSWNGSTEEAVQANLVKSLLFVFMHEMMHALRYHMHNQESLVGILNSEVVNIMGDSFINTELQKSLGMGDLINCIDQTVGFSGVAKTTFKLMEFYKEVKAWSEHLTGSKKIDYGDTVEGRITKGTEISISITVDSKIQKSMFGGNSNIYMIELARFLDKFLEVKSAESGQGKGKESSDNSDGKSQSQGDNGESGQSQSGDSGDSSSSGSSSGGEGSGGSERKKANESLNNEKAKNKAKSNLEDSINQANKDKTDESGGGEASDELLKSIGADKLARNFENIQSWKGKLTRMLKECMGTTERYNSELANARIEGQYGREEDVNVPKRIILAIDCSGSMGPDTFKKCLNEIENFMVANKYKRIEIVVIYWGSSAYDFKTKVAKNLVNQIKAKYKGLGGTNLSLAIQLVKVKYRKFDMLIVFTDGYIESIPEPESKAFLRRMCNRVLWVLTDAMYTENIKKYDSGAQRRIIKMR